MVFFGFNNLYIISLHCRALGETSTTEDLADLYIRSVVFSPDGKKLATGAENKTIRVWEIESKQVVYSFLGHDQEIYSLDWSKDGKVLVSGSGDRSIKVWDLEGSGRCSVTMVNTDDKLSPADPESDTKDAGVTSVAINNLYPCCVAAVSFVNNMGFC